MTYEFIGEFKPSMLLENKNNTPFHNDLRLNNFLLFMDKTSDKQFVVLNFLSAITGDISLLEFELREFNRQDKLIKKSGYKVQDLKVSSNKSLALPHKFKVSKEVSQVQVLITNLTLASDDTIEDKEIEVTQPKSEIVRVKFDEFKLPKLFSIIILLLSMLLVFGIMTLVA